MTRQRSIRPTPGGTVPKTAMVMAAGLGKRMRPLTATRPKPLVEVAGKPLIDHVLDRLRAAGVERVDRQRPLSRRRAGGASRSPHADGLEMRVLRRARPALLETGGGLAKARELFADEPLLVVNSDNLWLDGPVDAIRLLASRWDAAAMDALLLLVPLARANNHGGSGDFHLAAGRPHHRAPQGRAGSRPSPIPACRSFTRG